MIRVILGRIMTEYEPNEIKTRRKRVEQQLERIEVGEELWQGFDGLALQY